jgi:repressor LexA
MEKHGLPPQQRAVYDFIAGYHDKHGIAPTKREVAEAVGVSSSTAITYVEILCRKGVLRALPGIPRSLTVVRKQAEGGMPPALPDEPA